MTTEVLNAPTSQPNGSENEQRETGVRQFEITMGASARRTKWPQPIQCRTPDLKKRFSKIRVGEPKDGPCFLPGRLKGNSRKINEVESVDMLVYDIDGEQTFDEVTDNLDETKLFACVYTSHNHLTTTTKKSAKAYQQWAAKVSAPTNPTLDSMLEFLACNKVTHLKNVVFDLKNDEIKHFVEEDGKFFFVIRHDPVEKFRVVLPLKKRIVIDDLSCDKRQAIAEYKAIYHGVGTALGLKYDRSCEDPSRLYYLPSCKEGGEPRRKICSGDAEELSLLDHSDYPREEVSRESDVNKQRASRTPSKTTNLSALKAIDKNKREINLPVWDRGVQGLFDMEGMLSKCLPGDMIRQDRSGGDGFHIECPFQSGHSDVGGTGTFVVNDNSINKQWTIYCSHTSCKDVEKRKRLDYLAEFIHAGYVTAEDLENPEFGGIPNPQACPLDEEFVINEIDKVSADSDSSELERVINMVARLQTTMAKEKAMENINTNLGGGKLTVLRGALKQSEKALTPPRDNERPTYEPCDERIAYVNWDTEGEAHGATSERVADDLTKRNVENPRLFSMGLGPVRIKVDKCTGETVVEQLTKAKLRGEIDKVINFVRVLTRKDGDVDFRHVPCPDAIAEHVYNTPDLPFPELGGIFNTPFFDCDGNLITKPGYHPASKMYYAPPPGFAVPNVPNEPTDDEICRAKSLLFDNAFVDFPLHDGSELNGKIGKGHASRANLLAKLIQTVVREMIDGPCPLYVTQKPKARTGASLLTDVFSEIAFGHPAKAETEKTDPAEYQKTIISHLKAGSRHIFFDNLHKKLDDPTIATCVTAGIYQGRLLGGNEMVSEPVRAVFEVVGNNVTLSEELRWRTVLIRLDAEVENPAERDNAKFKHTPLLPWVKKNRGQLVWAILTLVQAWIARGRKPWTGKPLAAFESYCAVVGGILETAGIDGFLANRDLLRESVGDGDGVLKAFVQVWWDKFNDDEVKVGSLSRDADALLFHDDTQPLGAESNHHGRPVNTLVELLIVNSEAMDLGFNNWQKTGWQKGMGLALRAAKDQVFDIEDGTRVCITYRRSNTGMVCQLTRVTLH